MTNLNIRSLFLLSQPVAKRSMIPRKYGRIINMASIAGLRGHVGEPQMITNNTSKGAVVNFSRALATGWGQYGITVNALAPGFGAAICGVTLLALDYLAPSARDDTRADDIAKIRDAVNKYYSEKGSSPPCPASPPAN